MAKYKILTVRDREEIVLKRLRRKERSERHGTDYIVEALHDKKGYVSGYRLYHDLDDEIIVWLKLHGIIS
jgi:hypothetical protein